MRPPYWLQKRTPAGPETEVFFRLASRTTGGFVVFVFISQLVSPIIEASLQIYQCPQLKVHQASIFPRPGEQLFKVCTQSVQVY